MAKLIGAQAQPAVLGTMLELFMLGGQVPESALAAAFPESGLAGLLELGLLEAAPDATGSWRALVDAIRLELMRLAEQHDAMEPAVEKSSA